MSWPRCLNSLARSSPAKFSKWVTKILLTPSCVCSKSVTFHALKIMRWNLKRTTPSKQKTKKRWWSRKKSNKTKQSDSHRKLTNWSDWWSSSSSTPRTSLRIQKELAKCPSCAGPFHHLLDTCHLTWIWHILHLLALLLLRIHWLIRSTRQLSMRCKVWANMIITSQLLVLLFIILLGSLRRERNTKYKKLLVC